MIITATTVLCMGGILAAAVSMFVIGTMRHNDSLTFGGIGPLILFFILAAACCGELGGSRSLFELNYIAEAELCSKMCADCCKTPVKEREQVRIPNIPAISPQTIEVIIQK
jgi:hypothetical protein